MRYRLSNVDKRRLIKLPRIRYEKELKKVRGKVLEHILSASWRIYRNQREGLDVGRYRLELPDEIIEEYRGVVKKWDIRLFHNGREITEIRIKQAKKKGYLVGEVQELNQPEDELKMALANRALQYNEQGVEKLIEKWAAKSATKTLAKTVSRAKDTMGAGIKEGWTRNELRGALNKEFQDYNTYELDRVITTEQTRAINMGTFYEESTNDLVYGWTWEINYKGCPICDELAARGVMKKGSDVRVPPSHPNCYDNETEIYTDNGWKLFKDTEKGEKALTLNPVSQQLEWAKITNTVSYKADKVLHLTNKRGSFDMRVSKNHPFFGYKRIDRGKKGRQLEPVFYSNIDQLSKSEFRFAVSSEWRGKSPKHININGIEFETEQFCKLMGYYLSEGSTVLRKSGRHQIAIAQSKHLNKMWRDLKSLPVKRIWRGYKAIYISDERLGRYLIQFGKSNKKFVPDTIKRLSKEYIESFLNAFRLGDGNVKKGKNWKGMLFGDSTSYFTSSKRLADDLGELVIKSGKSVSYRLIPSKGKKLKFENGDYVINNNVWVISELLAKHRLFNSIDVVEQSYDDMVYDVEVSKNHTLLTRRNGRVVWGSNCECTLEPVFSTDTEVVDAVS